MRHARTTPSPPALRCWQCGADLPDASGYCTFCGAAQPAQLPAPDYPPAAPGSRRTLRLTLVGLGLVALLGALVTGAVLLLRDDNAKPGPTPPAVTPGRGSADTAAEEVTDGDARTLAERYAAAYSEESLPALNTLLAPSFQRKNGDEPVQGRAAALATYARQFGQLTDPVYRLSGLMVTTGPDRARAVGRYRISSDAGTVGGAIEFRMGMVAGDLLITRIVTVPDTPTPPAPAPEPEKSHTGRGQDNSGSRQYARHARIKTWWSSGAADAFVHFKAVDESTGQTVAEVLGSDNVDDDELQGPLADTPKRRALVDELRRMMVSKGWRDLGQASGGEWYEVRFGR